MEQSKYTLSIQSDGRSALTIRTDDEEELEQLIEKWEPRIVVHPQNGKEHNGARQDSKLQAGDQCPECSSDLVKRRGRNGNFIGCSGYPQCSFTARG